MGLYTKGRQMANKKNTWAGEERARGNLEAAHNIQKNVESLIDLMKNDKDNYSGHLKKAQNIQENLQSLIELTLKIQSDTQAFIQPTEYADSTPTINGPSKGISLPMNGSSDDWMDDDVGLTMEDEDEEEAKVVEIKTASIEPSKPSGISLPMNESSDDWMDHDVGLNMDDEYEEESKVDEIISPPAKPSGISLPMNGSSDDWMDDDVGLKLEDEEEETKVEEIKELKIKDKPESKEISPAETKKKKGRGKKGVKEEQ